MFYEGDQLPGKRWKNGTDCLRDNHMPITLPCCHPDGHGSKHLAFSTRHDSAPNDFRYVSSSIKRKDTDSHHIPVFHPDPVSHYIKEKHDLDQKRGPSEELHKKVGSDSEWNHRANLKGGENPPHDQASDETADRYDHGGDPPAPEKLLIFPDGTPLPFPGGIHKEPDTYSGENQNDQSSV